MLRLRSATPWLIMLLVPWALIGVGVRVLLTPAFLQFEYHLPGFPADDYGFSTADRLHWGMYGVNYLLNDADISYLGDLRLSNGAPLFSPRELSHMHDVKVVTRGLLRVWYVVLAGLALLGLWAWSAHWLTAYRRGLRLGGWLTLGLAALTAAIGTLGTAGSGDLFWQFFSDFHSLFFRGDSWLFAYSDTLIRLYPLRFWQDAVLYIGVIAALGALGLAYGLRDLPRKANG
jgi:integral membrane protein (TIGR01906 family)